MEAHTIFRSPYFPDSYLFPYNPDPLCPGNNYDIYDEMSMDDQCKAAVALKADMVVNTGWEIDCENPKVKEQVEKSLQCIHEVDPLQSSFDDALRELLSAYRYGFSLAEPVFMLGKDGMYRHRTILVRPPHTFQFNIDEKGQVEKVVQMTQNGPKDFDPSRFIHHTYQSQFGNPYGTSDFQAAHQAWVAKKHFMKMYCVFGERFATPTVVGKYEKNADPNDVTKLFNTLKKLQFNTTLVMPDDAQVDFLQVNGSSAQDFYTQAIDMCNTWIARAILVPDLLGISGSKTKEGSLALGSKQFEVFMGTILKDRESLAKKITMKLVRPLVLANFGDIECKFKFKPYTDDKQGENLKMWLEAVKAKIWDPNPQEIEYFRSAVKFPDGPVVVSGPQEIDPETGLPIPGTGKPVEKEPVVSKDPKKNPPAPEKDEKAEKPQERKYRRERTAYEAKMDFAKIEEEMDAAESDLLPTLKETTTKMYLDLVEQIRSRGVVRNFKPEVINDIKPRFLRDMNDAVRATFKDMFRKSVEIARVELFPRGSKKFIADDILPKEYLDILSAETFELVGNYSNDITKRAKALLIRGVKDGVGEGEVVKLLRDEMKANTDRWIATTARTKTTEIYNAARKTYWDNDPIAKELIVAYQFSAINDDRVSEVCKSLDQKVFTKGELTNIITPPLHFNCRSLLVPVTRYEDYTPSREPSVESLREKGANLLAVGEDK